MLWQIREICPPARRDQCRPTATISTKTIPFPTLVDTREAARILGRSVATLKRWRYEGTGPNWMELQGRVSYDVSVLLEFLVLHRRFDIAVPHPELEIVRAALDQSSKTSEASA